VIVRLLGGGQFRVADDLLGRLNELDDRAVAALDRDDEGELDECLDVMWQTVQDEGEPLPDDDLSTSDVIIPPSDLTLEETRLLFSDESGLIPELPSVGG
jgi:hypothetical protein